MLNAFIPILVGGSSPVLEICSFFSLTMDYTCVYTQCTQRIISAMQCICLVVVHVLYVVLVPSEQNLFISFLFNNPL